MFCKGEPWLRSCVTRFKVGLQYRTFRTINPVDIIFIVQQCLRHLMTWMCWDSPLADEKQSPPNVGCFDTFPHRPVQPIWPEMKFKNLHFHTPSEHAFEGEDLGPPAALWKSLVRERNSCGPLKNIVKRTKRDLPLERVCLRERNSTCPLKD